MKVRVFFTVIFSSLGMAIFAQAPNLAKVIPPSPNAQAIQKYGEIPVSPYTGVPNISIPIYTIKFRDVTVPVSISYHASGIKVGEEASQVGLGWILNAGGVISRNIVGDDDFKGSEYFNDGQVNALKDMTYNHAPRQFIVNGCNLDFANRTSTPTLETIDLTSYLNASPTYDFQPDQYFFNFLDHSGKFTLRKDRQAALQKSEKLEIKSVDVSGNAFQVKDLSGYVYDFAQYETNQMQGGLLQKTAWYLTKITSPTGNFVTFNYNVVANSNVHTISSYSEMREDYATPGIFPNAILNVPVQPAQAGMTPGRDYTSLQLSSIDFPNGRVSFNYSNRVDVSNDKMLDNVSIFSKDTTGNLSVNPLKIIELSHSYFDYGIIDDDYNSATIDNSKRLKLTGVVEKVYDGSNVITGSPYNFTYYEGGIYTLPSKTSFARDHWGYYNGKASNTSLIPSKLSINSTDEVTFQIGSQGPERDPGSSYVQAFSLASIKYPTGGSTDFEYEINDFDEVKSQANDNSYFGKTWQIVKKQPQYVYDNSTKNFSSPGNLVDLSDEYVYMNSTTGTSSSYNVHLLTFFRFSGPIDCTTRTFSYGTIKYDILDASGKNVFSKDIKDLSMLSPCTNANMNGCFVCQPGGYYSYNADVTLPPGKYTINITANDNSLLDVKWTFTYYSKQQTGTIATTTSNSYVTGGGLRIKRITNHDGIDASNDKIRKYIYHYFEDRNNDKVLEEYSFGKRMSRPNYTYFYPTNEKWLPCGSTSDCSYVTFFSDHLVRCSDSNVPLNGSAAGAVVGYDQVTVLEGENGENGKTVFLYTNSSDIISPYNSWNNLPIRPPYGYTIPELLNGSLKVQTEYSNHNGTFQKVREVTNTYESIQDNENTIYGMETRPYLNFNSVLNPFSRSQDVTTPCGRFLLCYLYQKSQWNYLSRTDEKEFASDDETKFQLLTTNYFYDNPQHLLPTRVSTNNSKGEVITTKTSYPLDYASLVGTDALTAGIVKLQNAHVINAPVEKLVQKSNADGTNLKTISATFTSYKPTVPLPDVVYSMETNSPTASFVPGTVSNGAITKDGTYQPRISFDSYDNSGNLTQQHKVNDGYISYLWGYNKTFPLAEVKNASSNEVFFEGFEETGTTGSSHTGLKYFNGDYPLNFVAPPGKSYKYSYWYRDLGVWKFSGIANYSGNVTLTFGDAIDDIRVYPENALMTTYTYYPLIGVTTQSDPNNRTIFYTYDAFGRLKLIKNQDGKILKVYEYKIGR